MRQRFLDASRKVALDDSRLNEVGDELADVLCYALALANELGLDVASCVRAKMEKNEMKYPVEQFRGRYGADDVPAERNSNRDN